MCLKLIIFIAITWYIFTIFLFWPPGHKLSLSLLVNQQIKLLWPKGWSGKFNVKAVGCPHAKIILIPSEAGAGLLLSRRLLRYCMASRCFLRIVPRSFWPMLSPHHQPCSTGMVLRDTLRWLDYYSLSDSTSKLITVPIHLCRMLKIVLGAEWCVLLWPNYDCYLSLHVICSTWQGRTVWLMLWHNHVLIISYNLNTSDWWLAL